MSISEKDAILRERAAFLRGVNELFIQTEIAATEAIIAACNRVEERAADHYPLPKVTRPRVVTDSEGDAWRWTPERGLEWCSPGIDWNTADASMINDACRCVVAGILANPTEETEEVDE
jgi:hypothetical protein